MTRDRRSLPTVAGAVALLLVAGFVARALTGSAAVLAQAGDARLTQAEAQNLLAALPAATREQLAEQPQALAEAMRREVQWRALVETARRSPQAAQPAVRARMRQAADLELVQAHLDAMSAVADDYPPQELIVATYEANRERFRAAPRYHLSQIFLAGRPDDADAARRARELAQEARLAKADFADLAREHSRHAESAARGGEVGWVSEPMLRPEFRDTVTAMAVGAISDPVPVADGWHILKLTERQAARDLSLDEARADIVTALRAQEQRRRRAEYVERLAAAMPVRLDELMLGTLQVPVE